MLRKGGRRREWLLEGADIKYRLSQLSEDWLDEEIVGFEGEEG